VLRLIAAREFVPGSLVFFPVFANLLWGQDSILQLLFCVLAARALKNRADFLAGCRFARGTLQISVYAASRASGRHVEAKSGADRICGSFAGACTDLGWARRARRAGRVARSGFCSRDREHVESGERSSRFPAESAWFGHGLAVPPCRAGGDRHNDLGFFSWFVFVAETGRKVSELGNSRLQFWLAIAVADLIAWQTHLHDFSLLVLPLLLIADYCFSVLCHQRIRWPRGSRLTDADQPAVARALAFAWPHEPDGDSAFGVGRN
jgi:hypothetical protein